MGKKVLIIHRRADVYADHLAGLRPDSEILAIREPVHASRKLPEEALPHLEDAAAIVSIGRWLDEETIGRCANLEWFQCLITGTDHLQPILRGRGITLTNARGIHGPQMAELTLLHMLVHMRQVPMLVRNQRDHVWDRIVPRVLSDRHVVILGVGAIAGDVARLCKAFGMRTTGVSRKPRAVDGFDAIVAREEMMEAVGEADFVVVLLPHSAETENFVDETFLNGMRADAALINMSRGAIVDEAALVSALKSGRIAFAGLDVFKTSPLPPESELWDLPNVFITPHVGGQSDRYDENAVTIVATNVEAFAAGEPGSMINIVPM